MAGKDGSDKRERWGGHMVVPKGISIYQMNEIGTQDELPT